MSSRLLIAYLLMIVLAAGLAVAIWRVIYNSERNVRRRARRERRARQHERLQAAEEERLSDSDS